jgi:hypothetical protein
MDGALGVHGDAHPGKVARFNDPFLGERDQHGRTLLQEHRGRDNRDTLGPADGYGVCHRDTEVAVAGTDELHRRR